jgi:hypothetical protein
VTIEQWAAAALRRCARGNADPQAAKAMLGIADELDPKEKANA